MARASIVIPTWNNPAQLRITLGSLLERTQLSGEVLVVDNGTGARSALPPRPSVPVRVLQQERNLGWMGGVNAGLREAQEDLFVMLNDDVLFPQGQRWFWDVLLGFLSDERVGAVGPASNMVAGVQSARLLGIPEVAASSSLMGVCLGMRTADLRTLGGLDEALPGGDDLDLSIRVRAGGRALLAVRRCYLHHWGSQTGQRLFGQDWDSPDSMERTNNALIQKHGVRRWFECMEASWRPWEEEHE